MRKAGRKSGTAPPPTIGRKEEMTMPDEQKPYRIWQDGDEIRVDAGALGAITLEADEWVALADDLIARFAPPRLVPMKWTQERRDHAVKLYNSGLGTRRVANEMNATPSSVAAALRKEGVVMRVTPAQRAATARMQKARAAKRAAT